MNAHNRTAQLNGDERIEFRSHESDPRSSVQPFPAGIRKCAVLCIGFTMLLVVQSASSLWWLYCGVVKENHIEDSLMRFWWLGWLALTFMCSPLNTAYLAARIFCEVQKHLLHGCNCKPPRSCFSLLLEACSELNECFPGCVISVVGLAAATVMEDGIVHKKDVAAPVSCSFTAMLAPVEALGLLGCCLVLLGFTVGAHLESLLSVQFHKSGSIAGSCSVRHV